MRGSWVKENQCRLRWRIGKLLPGSRDTWWDSGDESDVDEAHEALLGPGLRELDRYPDAAAVLKAAERGEMASAGIPWTLLDSGLLHWQLGERGVAEDELARYVATLTDEQRQLGHRKLVADHLEQLGLSRLAVRAAAPGSSRP